ncbi:MAG TPA: hypothetical protein VHA75_07520, partial [Rugosimonospora sp.]|nr:hypothetical protein [Rugosimonospora sp.]
TVPELRWHGRWRDRDVLVQQALPVWRQAGLRRGAAVARAMVELSGACGLAVAPFGESAYHDRLLRRLEATAGFGTGPGTGIPAGTGAGDRAIGRAAVPGQESVGRALWRAGREAFAKAGGLCLTFGAWHGDWTPWNTHVTGDAVLVWDWERFATGVPVGMDALHWRFQSMVDAGTPASVSAAALPHQAARLLDPFGVPPAAARFTALLYLLDMGARYLADGLDTRPQRLGDLASWLLPVVARETGLDLGTGRTPAPGQPGAPGGPGAVVGARGEG